LAIEAPPHKAQSTSVTGARRLSNRIGLWLACLAFLHGLVYLALTPPWQAPDEPQHFQYVRFLLDERRLPTQKDAAIDTPLTEQVRQSMLQFDFWALREHDTVPLKLEHRIGWVHPPLYYSLAAVALAPFGPLNVVAQLYIIRLFSVILTALTIWVSYQAMRCLFPDSPTLAISVPLFTALLPMHAFIGSSVNNDVLAELMGTVVIWLITKTFRHGLNWRRGALLIGVLSAALLTKRTTFFLVPLVAFTLLILLPPSGRRGVIIIGALAIPIWLVLLHQSPTSYIGGLLRTSGGISQIVTMPSLSNAALWGANLFTTFWGNFGWLMIPLSRTWYGLALIVTLVSGAGWISLAWRWRQSIRILAPWQRWAMAMWALAIALILTQTLGLVLVTSRYQQARYLFPAILPLATLLVLGWGACSPPSWQRRIIALGTTLMVFYDLIAITFYQIQYYYG
jgi:hypothetical protein